MLGHLDDASRGDCSDACGTQICTCAGCETYDEPCNDDGPDAQRRIIVYQGPS